MALKHVCAVGVKSRATTDCNAKSVSGKEKLSTTHIFALVLRVHLHGKGETNNQMIAYIIIVFVVAVIAWWLGWYYGMKWTINLIAKAAAANLEEWEE